MSLNICAFSLSFGTMFSAPFSSDPTFFLHLPFVVDILAEALLVVLPVPSQMPYQTGFSFPDFLLAFLDSVFVFFLGCLSMWLPLICLLLMFVRSSLFVYLAFLPLLLDVLLTRACRSWTWRRWSLKTNQLSCWWQVSEPTRVCCPEVQGCCPAICFIPSSYHPEFHHLMVVAAMTAPAFTFLAIFFSDLKV